MSVGELLIVGTQVGNNMKTRKGCRRNTQKILSCVTLTKEAHLIEQTDQPRPGTMNPKQEAHKECTGQRWAQTTLVRVWPNPWIGRPPTEAVQAHLWRKDCSYPLEGGYQRSCPYLTREPASLGYKKGLPHPSQHTTREEEELHSKA
jgi:hypothetical protein